MLHKIIQLYNRLKSCAGVAYSITDLTELLHKPWHQQEIYFFAAVIGWVAFVKIAFLFFLLFGKMLPFVFNKQSFSFTVWLCYVAVAVIGISNLICNYIHGKSLEMIIVKAVVIVIVLAYDWKESKELIKKFNDSEI